MIDFLDPSVFLPPMEDTTSPTSHGCCHTAFLPPMENINLSSDPVFAVRAEVFLPQMEDINAGSPGVFSRRG